MVWLWPLSELFVGCGPAPKGVDHWAERKAWTRFAGELTSTMEDPHLGHSTNGMPRCG